MKNHFFVSILIFFAFSSCKKDNEQLLNVTFKTLASGFSIPWAIQVIGEEDYLSTERLGKIYHYKKGKVKLLSRVLKTAFVRVEGLVYGGMMDISLHPQLQNKRLLS